LTEVLKKADLVLKEQKKGRLPHLIVLQSEIPAERYALTGLKSVSEFPVINMPFDHKYNEFPSL